MRRIVLFLLAVSLIFSLAMSASAITSASSVTSDTTVSSDGSCLVSMRITLRLEQAVSNLTFPIPRDATSVTLNGQRIRTQAKNDYRLIDLSKKLGSMAGEFTFTVGYELPDVIGTTSTGQAQLQLPLLSGFGYPIEKLEFTVTLHDNVSAKPAFSSGYHQSGIEQSLNFGYSGKTITGSSVKALKDHETLTMTVPVPEGMFHENHFDLPDLHALNLFMVLSVVLSFLLWLITLRCRPLLISARPTPPEGCNAGHFSSILTLAGADLTMLVFSWAQLGYLLIELDRHNRVRLHKQMDMGNERCEFERRCFYLLFSKRDVVDTGSRRYADLCLKVKKMPPDVQPYLKRRSGNPRMFRFVAATMGIFGGAAVGVCMSVDSAVPWLWAVLLAIAGMYSAYRIQGGAYCLFLRGKRGLWESLIHCAAWIVLAFVAGCSSVGIWVCVMQLLFGLMSAYGGRRTDAGRQNSRQVLGLRRYLRKADHAQLQRLLENDPDYFHNLAPYALALGVDKTFAKRFGGTQMSACPYLLTANGSHMTAYDWCVLMGLAADSMDAGISRRKHENFYNLLRNLRKS